MFTDVLYDDGHISLTLDERCSDGRLMVFFPNRFSLGLNPNGEPGRKFAAKHGLNAAIIRVKNPKWFTEPGFDRIVVLLDRLRARYPHMTFSGGSMGGSGMIRAAEIVPARQVILYAPLASIDPDDPPNETRFLRDFRDVGRLPLPAVHRAERYTVVVDRAHSDNRQLAMFSLPPERTRVLPLTGAGHNVAGVLRAMGVLGGLSLLLHSESRGDELVGLKRYLRLKKRETGAYLFGMFWGNLETRPAVARHVFERLRETGAFAHKYARMQTMLERRETGWRARQRAAERAAASLGHATEELTAA